MSVETVRFIGPIFVGVAGLASFLMLVVGLARDIERAHREGPRA